jgi:hypothetical protein
MTDEKIKRLFEGGKRVTVSSDIKDAFIHSICLIPDPAKRLEQCKEVFDQIRDNNIKAYMKSHPEVSQATAEVQENQDEAAAGVNLNESWDRAMSRLHESSIKKLSESEGFIKVQRSIHQSLDQILNELEDPDTSDERVLELYRGLQALKLGNLASTAMEVKNYGL